MENGQTKYTRDQHRVSDLTDLLFWERKIDVVEFQWNKVTHKPFLKNTHPHAHNYAHSHAHTHHHDD